MNNIISKISNSFVLKRKNHFQIFSLTIKKSLISLNNISLAICDKIVSIVGISKAINFEKKIPKILHFFVE